jgi:hypothetical protein
MPRIIVLRGCAYNGATCCTNDCTGNRTAADDFPCHRARTCADQSAIADTAARAAG